MLNPSSIALVTFSKKVSKLLKQDLPRRNLCCDS